jgi:hypothetical protein
VIPVDLRADIRVALALKDARTALERAYRTRVLLFWSPADTASGKWEATWRSPSGRLSRHEYPGQVAMIDDALNRFGVPS